LSEVALWRIFEFSGTGVLEQEEIKSAVETLIENKLKRQRTFDVDDARCELKDSPVGHVVSCKIAYDEGKISETDKRKIVTILEDVGFDDFQWDWED